MSRVEVHKFGGTSVGDAHRMLGDASLIADAAKNAQIVVVASAMTKVTDGLIQAAETALSGERREALQLIAGLLTRHEEALQILAPEGGEAADTARAEIVQIIRALQLGCGEVPNIAQICLLLCGLVFRLGRRRRRSRRRRLRPQRRRRPRQVDQLSSH